MKDQPPFPFEDPSQERFIDATLREHVRIGSAEDDSDLVRSILMETVERPVAVISPAKSDDRRLWIAGVASAAAILAALATLLAVLPFRPSSRNSEEIRFIVQYGEVAEAHSADVFSAPPQQRDPLPFSGSIEINIPHEPVETSITTLSKPEPLDIAFAPSFSEVPKPGFREDRLQIVADQMTELDSRRIYEGNVEVRHENFRLTSERVELIGHDDDESTGAVRLTSWNALLEHASPGRTALAEQLDYEPSNNRFSLLGVAFLNSPEGQLTDFDPEDRVYLIGETMIVQKVAQPR